MTYYLSYLFYATYFEKKIEVLKKPCNRTNRNQVITHYKAFQCSMWDDDQRVPALCHP